MRDPWDPFFDQLAPQYCRPLFCFLQTVLLTEVSQDWCHRHVARGFCLEVFKKRLRDMLVFGAGGKTRKSTKRQVRSKTKRFTLPFVDFTPHDGSRNSRQKATFTWQDSFRAFFSKNLSDLTLSSYKRNIQNHFQKVCKSKSQSNAELITNQC